MSYAAKVFKNEMDKLLLELKDYIDKDEVDSALYVKGKLYGLYKSLTLMLVSELIRPSQYRELDKYFNDNIGKIEN